MTFSHSTTLMSDQVNSVNFLNISPFVRHIHHLPDATPQNHYLPWRYIYDYEFIFVIDGNLTVCEDNETYELEPGDIHIMPPMIRHRRIIKENEFCNYFSIHFDFVYMAEEDDFSPQETYIDFCNTGLQSVPIDPKLSQRPLYMLEGVKLPRRFKTINTTEYIKHLNQMCTAFLDKPFAYEIDLKCSMMQIFKLMLCEMQSAAANHCLVVHKDITLVIQYLYEHLHEPIDFNMICKKFGYSNSNFRNLFKMATGMPPNQFLLDLRLNKATELLYEGDLSVTQIAEVTGFTDNHYFSRIFKQKKGFSPSQLIKKRKEEIADVEVS